MDSFMLNAALYVRDPRHDHNQAAAATSTIAAAASSTTTTSSSASATTHHGHHSGVNYTCPVPNEQGPRESMHRIRNQARCTC